MPEICCTFRAAAKRETVDKKDIKIAPCSVQFAFEMRGEAGKLLSGQQFITVPSSSADICSTN